MLNIHVKNDNAQPVRVVAGPRSELMSAVANFIKDGAEPEDIQMATLEPDEEADLQVAEVDVVVFYMPPVEGKGDGTFALDIRNDTPGDIRIQYGDAMTGELEDSTLGYGMEVTIEGTDTWRIAVSLLGVEGEHMPPVDPDAFTKGA